MTRTPWVLRGGDDPVETRRALAEQAERHVASALRHHRDPHRTTRHAPLVIAAAALDTLAADAPDVDLLNDDELAAAAGRAGINLADMGRAETEALRGYVTAVRGAAGENWVVDGLASGGLPAPAGTDRIVLQDFTEPGADLVFYTAGGDVLSAANVKVAADADVIVEHFTRYSDVVPVVYATSDAAADAAHRGLVVVDAGAAILPHDGPVVVDIGQPSSSFDEDIAEALAGTAADSILDELPWFSMGMIGVRALRRLQAGATRADVLRGAGEDAVRAGVVLSAGRAATELGAGDPLTLAISVGVGWAASAALEVRSTWRAAGQADTLLADLAEQITARHRGRGVTAVT